MIKFGKVKEKVFAFIVTLSIISIISCEIGLGAAVDIAVPSSGVSYPPQNAIVRDTFVAAGTCEDDQSIKAVKVTVIDTENNKNYGPYDATLSEDKKSWTITLNHKDTSKASSVFDSYKQWEIPDGNYVISAIAYDTSDKESPAATCPISIDNTAPVLIVSKPLGNSLINGVKTVTQYGRSFTLAGDVAETHETSKIFLKYKDASNGHEDTIELQSVEALSSSNPLIIAKYYNNAPAMNEEKTNLRNTYIKLYGTVDETINSPANVDKMYYCSFLLEDNARQYINPGDSGSGSGNQSSEYYNLSDEVSSLFGSLYSLDVTKLMQIINGKTLYSDAQISEITRILNKEGNKASSTEIEENTSSKFIINPNNSPLWFIDGYGLDSYDDIEEDNSDPNNIKPGAKSYTAGNILSLSVKAGRDNIYIKPNTVKAELFHLKKNGSEYSKEGEAKTIIAMGDWTDPAADSATTQISLDVGDFGLVNNNYYEIVVNGEDRNGVSLEPEASKYIFKLSSNGAAPIIEFTEGLNRSWVKGDDIKDSFDITGKIISSTNVIKDKVTIDAFLVKDNNDASNTPSVNARGTCQPFGTGNTSAEYPFTIIVTPNSGKLVPANPTEGSKFTYTITVKVQDEADAYSLKTLTLFVDNKKPSLSISGINPVISGASAADDKVNGKIKINGTASDNESGLASLSYYVKDSSNNPVISETEIPAINNWNFEFNTTALTETDSGNYTIYIKAVDKVGNEFETSSVIHVDQSSDTPVFSLTNAYYEKPGTSDAFTEVDIDKDHNLFDTVSNKTLYGSVTDDDGIDKVEIWYKGKTDTVYTEKLNPKVIKNGKVATFNCEMPAIEGVYSIKIVATDTLSETSLDKIEKEFPIAVNNNAPQFKDITPASSEANYVKDSLTVSGKIIDSTGSVTITSEHTGASASNIEITDDSWSDTFTLPSASGKYTVKYTAENKYKQTSTHTIVYSVDVDAPEIISKKINNTDFTGWWNDGNVPLSVVVTDSHSGVSKVEYSLSNAFTNLVEMTQSGNTWSESIQLEDASSATIYIRATDKVGNKKEDSISIKIDNNPPTLSQQVYKIASEDIQTIDGTVFVKANETITVYGNYSDTPSGVTALSFTLGGAEITPEEVKYSDNILDETHSSWDSLTWGASPDVNTKSWKATLSATSLSNTLSDAALIVKGEDAAGNKVTAAGLSITKDVKAPDIVGISIQNKKEGDTALTEAYKSSSDTYYLRNKKDGKIKVSGISADVNISETKLEIQGYKENGSSAGDTYKLSYNGEKQSSWTFENIDMTDWPANIVKAIATITAVDKAGNPSTSAINLIFDEKAPVLHFEQSEHKPGNYTFRGDEVIKYSAVKIGQGVYSESSYGQLPSIDFTFYYDEEGSSFDEIEYQLLTADKTSSPDETITWDDNATSERKTGTLKVELGNKQHGYSEYKYYESETDSHEGLKVSGKISGFATTNGMNLKNLLLIRAKDKCGNVSEPKLLRILLDQSRPEITIADYDGKKVNGNILTNGNSITLSGSIKDIDAGIKAIRLYINGSTTKIFEFNSKNPPETDTNTGLTVTAKKWNKDSTEEDKYEETTPASDDAVKITLSNNWGEFTFEGFDSNPDVQGETVSRRSLNSAAAYVKWTATITPNNDTAFGDTKTPFFILEAEDWAEHSGNGNFKTEKIGQLLVDKTSPEVIITDPVPSANNPLNGLQTIRGTASDLHELQKVSLYISTAETAPVTKEAWGTVKKEIIKSDTVPVSALYSYKFENVDMKDYANANTGKGKVHVLVVAEDIAGNESAYNNSKTYDIDYDSDRPVVTISDISLSGVADDKPLLYTNKIINLNISDDDGIKSAKYSIIKDNKTIVDKESITLNSSGTGTINLPVDDKEKQIQGAMQIQFFVEDTVNENVFNSTSDKAFERIKLVDTSGNSIVDSNLYLSVDTNPPEVVFAGITKTSAYDGSDESSFVADGEEITSGYSNVVLGGTTKAVKIRFTATDEGIGVDASSAMVTVKLNDNPVTGSPFPAKPTGTENEYYVIFPCNTGDGILKIEVSAKEDAEEGMTSSDVKSFTLDNTNPVIKLTGPSETSYQSGATTGTGNFSEASTLYYAISPIAPVKDSNGKIENSPDKYNKDTIFSYDYVNNTGNAVPLTAVNLYQKCSYICPSESRTNLFYIYFDGDTEGASGASIHSAFLNDWLIDMGITTADEINRSENPFSKIVKLYMYIKAKDAAGNLSEDVRTILVDPRGQCPIAIIGYPGENGLTLGGPITLMGTVTGKNPISKVYVEVSKNGGTTYETPLEATVSGSSWHLAVNTNNELNPPDGVDKQPVVIRVSAKDNKNSMSGYESRSFFVDKDTPVIGQSVTLVQWKAGYNGSIYNETSNPDGGIVVTTDASGKGSISIRPNTYTALRNYTDKMSLRKKWYLIGTVTDDNGLNNIQINENPVVSAAGESYSAPATNPDTYVCPMDEKNNYYFCIPIGVDTDGFVGQNEVVFSATENKDSQPKTVSKKFTVKVDNKAPDLTSTGELYNINKNIVNNHGFYTFGSVANEDKVGDVEQTGVARIAFWYTLETESNKRLYDVMIQNDKTGNKLKHNESTPADNDVEEGDEGLWWKKKTGVSVSGAALTITASDVNIHIGGLAKVNGSIYTITDVQNNTITLNEAPGAATEAYFAIANVIDNPIAENQGKKLITDEYGWGYYKDSDGSAYDDKDNMIETLVESKKNNILAYTWSASINSRNLDDGPVDLHYVVFDKAGNATTVQKVECTVKNNAPRIAGLKIGTDQNGDKKVTEDADEFITTYDVDPLKATNLYSEVTYSNQNKGIITVKGRTVIQPEILGGNGDLKYTFIVTKENDENKYYTMNSPVIFGKGTKSDDTNYAKATDGNGLASIILPVSRFIVKDNEEEIVDADNQKFTFYIEDSTPGRTASDKTNQQTATLNVIMNVALRDNEAARNYIMPFYWHSLKDNSVYSSKTPTSVADLGGHIELPEDLKKADGFSGVTNPKVSGKIKIEGIASDNNIINNLTATIKIDETRTLTLPLAERDSAATAKDIGYLKTANKTLKDDGWQISIKKATYGEYVVAGLGTKPDGKEDSEEIGYITQDYGHIVHWILTIDTEKLLGDIPVQENVEISVTAKDYGNPKATIIDDTDSTLDYETTGTGTNSTYKYKVDVVPYIQGLKTKLSEKSGKVDTSEFDRTALGHYPVGENEQIYIYGFNLKGGELYDIDGASVAYAKITDDSDPLTTKYNEQGFDVYKTSAALSSFKSGKVSVKVNGIESLNNKNYNGSKGSYSKADPITSTSETSVYGAQATYTAYNNYFYNHTPNQTTNYTLTDDVVLDMWQFNPEAAKPNPSGRVDEPIMKINPKSGIIGFAFLSGARLYSMPKGNNNSYNGSMQGDDDGDYHAGNGFAYDADGNAYAIEVGGDEKGTNGPGAEYFVHIAPYGGGNQTTKSIAYIKEGGQYYRYKYKSTSIAATVHGDAGNNLYMAYYDSVNGRIHFRSGNSKNNYGLFNSKDDSNVTTTKNSQVIACNSATDYTNYTNGGDNKISASPLGRAGKYVSIDVKTGTDKNNDVVVLVWYDENANALKYTYNTNPLDTSWRPVTPTDTSGLNHRNWKEWDGAAKTIFTGGGEYCQIKLDALGGVHIAAKNEKGGVKYAYLSAYNALDGENATVTTYDVDTYGSVGGHLTLDVALDTSNKPVPYISYIGANIAKIAYLKNTARGPGVSGSKFTNNWEVSYIPSSSKILNLNDKEKDMEADSRVSVGVWKASDGKITNSTAADGTNRKNEADATSGTCWGNGTANPVVAYQTQYDDANERIETAQMKD